MTQKWYELATKSLEQGDEEQYSFSGRYDHKDGYIVLSKEKLLFVEEHGVIHRSASLLFEIPYDRIETIRTRANSRLEIITTEGAKRSITTNYLPHVKSHLEQLMKQAKIEVVAAPVA